MCGFAWPFWFETKKIQPTRRVAGLYSVVRVACGDVDIPRTPDAAMSKAPRALRDPALQKKQHAACTTKRKRRSKAMRWGSVPMIPEKCTAILLGNLDISVQTLKASCYNWYTNAWLCDGTGTRIAAKTFRHDDHSLVILCTGAVVFQGVQPSASGRAVRQISDIDECYDESNDL